ncbi:hypothetical protein C8J57DRAFT_1718512 [Mycena rebaudengoi]|nr:hypothetical protein C8J57DRAFT_1718512 [Mycena rebaudengoi]
MGWGEASTLRTEHKTPMDGGDSWFSSRNTSGIDIKDDHHRADPVSRRLIGRLSPALAYPPHDPPRAYGQVLPPSHECLRTPGNGTNLTDVRVTAPLRLGSFPHHEGRIPVKQYKAQVHSTPPLSTHTTRRSRYDDVYTLIGIAEESVNVTSTAQNTLRNYVAGKTMRRTRFLPREHPICIISWYLLSISHGARPRKPAPMRKCHSPRSRTAAPQKSSRLTYPTPSHILDVSATARHAGSTYAPLTTNGAASSPPTHTPASTRGGRVARSRPPHPLPVYFRATPAGSTPHGFTNAPNIRRRTPPEKRHPEQCLRMIFGAPPFLHSPPPSTNRNPDAHQQPAAASIFVHRLAAPVSQQHSQPSSLLSLSPVRPRSTGGAAASIPRAVRAAAISPPTTSTCKPCLQRGRTRESGAQPRRAERRSPRPHPPAREVGPTTPARSTREVW